MNKFQYDANQWKEKRARYHIPDPVPLTPTIEDLLPEIGFVLETRPEPPLTPPDPDPSAHATLSVACDEQIRT
jgi:hypothetical protein